MGIVNQIVALDDNRKSTKTELDNLNAQVNSISKEIGDFYKAGKRDEAETKKAEVLKFKDQIQKVEEELRSCRSELTKLLLDVSQYSS